MTESKNLSLRELGRLDAETAAETLTSVLYRNRLKRLFDVVGALGLLVLFAPVMLVVAFLVKLDGGPAIFGHRRIGADGRTFKCYKFRSMVMDAETVLQDLLARDAQARAEWERDHKLKNDPRVTRLGNFLRRTSLDELPQLFNILFGDMSIVGPRPIVAGEVARYRDAFIFYTQCRPGLTGLWQVSGRSDCDYRQRVQFDTEYVLTWSFFRDILICFRTAKVVLLGAGAY